jgi:hypothetical protein
MDSQQASIIAFCGLAVSVATAVIGAINHRRVRSECCGKVATSSLEIDQVTPKIDAVPREKSVAPV